MRRRIFSLGRRILPIVIIVGLVFGVITDASAATEKPYYKGKVVIFVCAMAAGGSTDMLARLVSRHLPKFIPGSPIIVVRNMPGGGGMVGASYAFNAKPNGLTFLVVSASNVTTNILRPKGTDFKLEEMNPIYSSPSGAVFFTKRGLLREPKDIMTAKGIIFGHMAATGGTTSCFVWAKELLGFNTEKMVLGYDSSSPARLAFLSGETNFCGESSIGYNSVLKPYVDRGEVVPVFQSGILDANGNVVRERAAPDVPTPLELYEQLHGRKPSGLTWEVYKLVVGSRTCSRAIVLPPRAPSNVLNIVTKAVADMAKDPNFLAEAEKESPKGTHCFGQELVHSYPLGVSGPPEVIGFMKKVLTEKYGVVFD